MNQIELRQPVVPVGCPGEPRIAAAAHVSGPSGRTATRSGSGAAADEGGGIPVVAHHRQVGVPHGRIGLGYHLLQPPLAHGRCRLLQPGKAAQAAGNWGSQKVVVQEHAPGDEERTGREVGSRERQIGMVVFDHIVVGGGATKEVLEHGGNVSRVMREPGGRRSHPTRRRVPPTRAEGTSGPVPTSACPSRAEGLAAPASTVVCARKLVLGKCQFSATCASRHLVTTDGHINLSSTCALRAEPNRATSWDDHRGIPTSLYKAAGSSATPRRAGGGLKSGRTCWRKHWSGGRAGVRGTEVSKIRSFGRSSKRQSTLPSRPAPGPP